MFPSQVSIANSICLNSFTNAAASVPFFKSGSVTISMRATPKITIIIIINYKKSGYYYYKAKINIKISLEPRKHDAMIISAWTIQQI